MNAIEIFQKVKQHLLKQGCRATDYMENCQYRGDDDRQCSIGCLIPDSHYDSIIEGIPLRYLVDEDLNEGDDEYPGYEKLVDILIELDLIDYLPLLVKLQYIHDSLEVEEWEPQLKELEPILSDYEVA